LEDRRFALAVAAVTWLTGRHGAGNGPGQARLVQGLPGGMDGQQRVPVPAGGGERVGDLVVCVTDRARNVTSSGQAA